MGAVQELAPEPGSDAAAAVAGRPRYYYRHGVKEGAHAFYNPWSFVLEGGFGALYNRRLDLFDYRGGIRNLGRTFAAPHAVIGAYGWRRFLWREFVPHAGAGSNWSPNWSWHFIGGGFRTRLLKEYFTANGYRNPTLSAWLTMYAAHLLNEVHQAEKFSHGSTDALADLLFFDWAGKLIFELEVVNRIASTRLHLTEWSFQSQLNPLTGRLINNGQLYWLRVSLGGALSLSILTGEQANTLNATFVAGDGHQLSFGVGAKPRNFAVSDGGETVAWQVVRSVGVYYSIYDNPVLVATYEPGRGLNRRFRDDSKTVTANNNRGQCSRLTINLYPGWYSFLGVTGALTIALFKDAAFVGIGSGALPVGFVGSTPQSAKYRDDS